jgi:tetratricopeptide (TPR) repeat protein
MKKLTMVLGIAAVASGLGLAFGGSEEDLLDRANEFQRQGNHMEAKRLYSAALAELEGQPASPRVFETLNNLGAQFQILGDYAAAERYYIRALSVWRPEWSVAVARTRSNLAGVYQAQGRFKESEALYHEVLTDLERQPGPATAEYALALGRVAELYRVQGRYTQALIPAERALAIMERAKGPRDAAVVPIENTLAAIYRGQGKLNKARELFERSVSIGEATQLGADATVWASSLNNLAEIACVQGDFPLAESYARRALAILEKSVGPDHPNVGVALNNLAQAVRFQKRYTQAEPLYRRALGILEKAPGRGAVAFAECLGNYADFYHSQGYESRAVERYQRALAVMKQAPGDNRREVALLMKRLAEVHRVRFAGRL